MQEYSLLCNQVNRVQECLIITKDQRMLNHNQGPVLIVSYSGAPAARRAAKRSPITIGTGSHAYMEIETNGILFSW